MTKRMLIDATHAEETRVVVLDGNRLEDFDVETSTKRQLKGNIYLAKVVRVEPSLQACFVEYGGNRHGFLAFSEIHPDYYQIPVADRQRLLDLEAEEAQREEEEADREAGLAPDEAAPARTQPEPRGDVGVNTAIAASPAFQEATEPTAPDTASDMVAPRSIAAAAESADESGVTAEVLAEAHAPEPVAGPAPIPESAPIAQSAPIPEPAPEPAPETESAQAPEPAPGNAPEPAPQAPEQPEAAAGSAVAGMDAEPSSPAARPEAAPQPEAQAATPPHPAVETAPGATESPPDDEPEPPARRAQPLIIEQETVSGPADTEEAAADSAEAPDTDRWQPPEEQPRVRHADEEADPADDESDGMPESPPPETVGGEQDGTEDHRERRIPPRFLRNYKIQEVIRRRQILLVQVVKEERGTKGAALTTYLSLAGRFSVLMPNSPRGGGISRKITSATDRRRLKEVIAELDMPKGMGLIVRTAGANRPKPEIKRDCEYLLRLWDDIREHTMKSVAPALIYEEASLIKRAIRDVYSRDIDEIQVDGEEGWKAAHEFMRMLMPSHAKKVQLWRDQSQPLFARYQVEAQLDGMLQPTVQLRSGGYLVINQTEALVAIDVNSGRSTRERNVEETALRTNLEAVDEVARQLRLRDLAGLIVIDLIDMEARKHNAMVERRIKEALKNDRARIQVGHISHFGLLEMSRQRLRPSLAETSFILCPHCGGTGHVRSTESAAIYVLRGIEDEGSKRRAAEIVVHVATPTALYMLNHKRDRLREIESRYGMRVTVLGDDTQMASQYRIDRVRPQVAREGVPAAVTPDLPPPPLPLPAPVVEAEEEEEVVIEEEAEAEDSAAEAETDEAQGDAESGDEKGDQADRRRRRRRRRRGGRREDGAPAAAEAPLVTGEPEPEAPETLRTAPEGNGAEEEAAGPHIEGVPEFSEPSAEEDRNRRRGRRGGRRRRRDDGEASPFAAPGAEQPELPPVYAGPTPANPFGGQAFDIFDVLEQAEANAAAARSGPPQPMVQQFEPEPGATRGFAVEQGALSFRAVVIGEAGTGLPGAAESAGEAPEIANAVAPEPAVEAVAEPGTTAGSADAGVPTNEAPVAAEAVTAPAEAPVAAEESSVAAELSAAAEEPFVLVSRRSADAGEPSVPAAEPSVVVGEPSAASRPAEQSAADAEPAQPEVANDESPEPAIRPIIIGSGEEMPEKKRGWWRR